MENDTSANLERKVAETRNETSSSLVEHAKGHPCAASLLKRPRVEGRLWQLLGIILIGIGFICIKPLLSAGLGAVRDVITGEPGGVLSPLEVVRDAITGGLGGVLSFLGVLCFNRGRKYRVSSAQALLTQDTRSPVLYLRSFKDDSIAAQPTVNSAVLPWPATEEQQLAFAMSKLGPFVAIGRPGEALPELGAARLYVSDDEWQDTVTALMSQAQLVIMRAGESEGFWWEVQRAEQLVRPERLLFLIPYGEKQYEIFRQRAQKYLPCHLPEYSVQKCFLQYGSLKGLLYFGPDWTPHFIDLWKKAKLPLMMRIRAVEARKPVATALKIALRPIFEQLHIKWTLPPIRRGVIVSWVFTGVSVIGGLVILGWGISTEFRPKSSLEKAIAQFAERLMAIPEFRARFASLSKTEAYTFRRELGRKAMSRLNDEKLRVRTTIMRKVLTAADIRTCAAIERGTASRSQTNEALNKLGSADVNTYFTLMEEAIRAELRALPRPKTVEEDQIAASFNVLLHKLPRDQAERLMSVYGEPSQASDADICWAGRTFFTALSSLDEPHQSVLARAIVQ
jgi:hypothetical protein